MLISATHENRGALRAGSQGISRFSAVQLRDNLGDAIGMAPVACRSTATLDRQNMYALIIIALDVLQRKYFINRIEGQNHRAVFIDAQISIVTIRNNRREHRRGHISVLPNRGVFTNDIKICRD